MSEKVLIMPNRGEREREADERSDAASDPPPSTINAVALQRLFDLERALGQLETSVTGLERTSAQQANDLNGLGKAVNKLREVEHTAKTFGQVVLQIAVAVIASGTLFTIAAAVAVYLFHHLSISLK